MAGTTLRGAGSTKRAIERADSRGSAWEGTPEMQHTLSVMHNNILAWGLRTGAGGERGVVTV